MISGLRMEKGTAALGGLETWSILEGMPAWADPGAMVRAAKDREGYPLICRASRGKAPELWREDPHPHPTPPPRQEQREEWEETSSQFPGGKQQNTKIKINILNDCSAADLPPKGAV